MTNEFTFKEDTGAETVAVPLKYRPLFYALLGAFDEAAHGKGEARHGLGKPFLEQPVFQIMSLTSIDFSLGQAIKKIQEASTFLSEDPHSEAATKELRGAIGYLGAAILHIKQAQP